MRHMQLWLFAGFVVNGKINRIVNARCPFGTFECNWNLSWGLRRQATCCRPSGLRQETGGLFCDAPLCAAVAQPHA